jgi:hypothetical protein
VKTSTLRFVTVRNPEPAHPAVYALPFDPSTLQTEADNGQSLYKKLDDVHKNAALKPTEKIEEIRDAVEAFKSSASFTSDAKQFDGLYRRNMLVDFHPESEYCQGRSSEGRTLTGRSPACSPTQSGTINCKPSWRDWLPEGVNERQAVVRNANHEHAARYHNRGRLSRRGRSE